MQCLIGVDFGGTKVEGAMLAPDGKTLARLRVRTPRDDYSGSIDCIVDLVRRLECEAGTPGSVGVGIPGVVSPLSGLVKNANSVWLNGKPFDRDLANALGRPIRMANDANCFALSEAMDGAGAGAAVVFGVILGTGVGGGVVANGRLLTGRHRVAGEWGHNPLPWMGPDEFPGPKCWCGKHGCHEVFLSGPAIAADYERRSGKRKSVEEIIASMRGGEGEAESVFTGFVERLARGLAHVVNILDPDVIVLGGGLSNIDEIYRHAPRELAKWVFSDACSTPIIQNKHGDSSGVRGAAQLWSRARMAGA